MALRRRAAALLVLGGVALLLTGIATLAAVAPEGAVAEPNATAAPLGDGDLPDLHAAGVTGENVSVGVVDVTGFDRDRPAIANQVVAARAFGPGATVAQGGHSDHGTAAAAVTARTAPDSDLYLAAFGTRAGYERAVQWLLANDVDVIVAPVSFYGRPGDGSTRVARVASEAVRQDAVVVASAGNLADSHWRARYDDVEDRTLVADGSRRTYLGGEGGHVTLWLSWEGASDDTYTLELYRETSAGDGTSGSDGDAAGEGPQSDEAAAELVATSRNVTGDAVPNQRLEADVAGGRYFFVVRGPAGPTGDRLRVTSPTHEFSRTTPAGSLVAPATAEGVLAVGAYDGRRGRVARYSSRGPTLDGRLGVDVVAPARVGPDDGDGPYLGTSAAAAYTGGVAALLRDEDPDRSPRTIEHALEARATDVNAPGPDPATGYGRVDAYRSVLALANGTG